MPKVVHVLRKFEPDAWGGTETHLIALLRELVRMGWDCEVHAPREAGTDGSTVEAAGAVFRTFRARYPYLGMSEKKRAGLVAAGGNLVSFDELAKIALTRADVFHLHTSGRLGGVVRSVSKLRRIPYAVTLHGPVRAHADVARSDARRRVSGMLDLGAPFGMLVGARRVVQDADLVYVLNKAEEEAWRGSRRGRHLERVAHGVDLTPASEADREAARHLVLGLENVPFVALIARIDRAKGQDLAVRAFAKAAPEDVHLVLAGSVSDASYEGELTALVREQGVEERVHFLGGVSPQIARALLAESVLALVPSRSEPFGIVLLEAWAEGTAALFSDVGGMADIARNTRGEFGLTRPDDLSAWTERMGSALRDPDSLRTERNQVQERVAKHYTWRSLAEKIVSGYNRVRH